MGRQHESGRPLSSGIPIEFLNIVKPGTTNYDRLTQVDLRWARTEVQNAGRWWHSTSSTCSARRTCSADLLAAGATSTYLNPLSITVARLFKISAQIDF
jgi:hypothetical protein